MIAPISRMRTEGSSAHWIRRELRNGIGGTLMNVARSHQAGMIAVGTRGRSNVKSLLLGSVAYETVSKSALPVLVVPDKTGSASDLGTPAC